VWTQSRVIEVHGDTRLSAITIRRELQDQTEQLPASSLFIFIGASPRTEWLGDLIARDGRGFILSGPDLLRDGKRPAGWTLDRDPGLLETNIPGIFAVGDVRHGSIKRVASGVGEGAVVVQFIHQYLAKVQ
jgi:thioredoxin reductase (NADPH)